MRVAETMAWPRSLSTRCTIAIGCVPPDRKSALANVLDRDDGGVVLQQQRHREQILSVLYSDGNRRGVAGLN